MTTEELIAAQFYSWERRGRGWQVWDCPVELEPPFEPFPGYYFPASDDARQATKLSAFVDKLHGKHMTSTSSIDVDLLIEDCGFAQPIACFFDSPLTEIQIDLPTKSGSNREASERLLLSLATARFPIGFEVIGLGKSISMQFVCRGDDNTLLHSNLKAYFPDARFGERTGFLEDHWSQLANIGCEPVIVDFGLSHEFVIPLPSTSGLSIDTLTGIVGTLSEVASNELALFQVLFRATTNEWASNVIRATTDYDGHSILANAPRMADQMKQKLSQPLFSAVLRVGTASQDRERSWSLAKRLGNALLTVFPTSGGTEGNELIPLSNEGYDEFSHEEDLLLRQSHRSGMILNANELLSVAHIPAPSLRSEKFRIETKITKAAPHLAIHSDSREVVLLGENTHDGSKRTVSLTNDQRSKHIHILGATGSGKSTFFLNLIKQDLANGTGLCVLDPHGDLIEDVMASVPDLRREDVILFDPSDTDHPIGLNILHANSELEKTLLSSDLVATFRRMSTSWGDVMDSVMANCILAFVESSRGGTLFDLKRFLVEKPFRNDFIETVRDDTVRYFWQNEFPLIGGKAPSSILIRLDAFLRQKLIRNIVCQKQTKLDFRKIMDERKVLLIKLSQGLIGEENAHLLGTLLISKLYQTALSRQDSTDRPFFACYLDEFHHFVTPSMENVLSGSRKYNLGLALAHQEFRQLQSRSQEVANSVLSNCYTRVCFRLGDADSEKFAGGFSAFDSKSLQSLGIGEAIARIERSEFDFNLAITKPNEISASVAKERRRHIVERTRSRCGRNQNDPSEITESQIMEATEAEAATVTAPLPSHPNRTKESATPISNERYGKGGQHHKDIQAVIKRIGESCGFAGTLEKLVLDGAGSVDVSLETEGLSIACEVSVTSTKKYETKNILKCLSAGYDHICVVVSNHRNIPALRNSIRSNIPLDQQGKVSVFRLTDLLAFLRKLTASAGVDKPIREKPDGQRLTISEACEFFGVAPSTLYRWVREGRVPCYRPGREYQFDRDELALIGRHDLSGKRKPKVDLQPIKIEEPKSKGKKQQDDRYRKMLNLD